MYHAYITYETDSTMKCTWLKSQNDVNGWETYECAIPDNQNCPFLDNPEVYCEIKKVIKELIYE